MAWRRWWGGGSHAGGMRSTSVRSKPSPAALRSFPIGRASAAAVMFPTACMKELVVPSYRPATRVTQAPAQQQNKRRRQSARRTIQPIVCQAVSSNSPEPGEEPPQAPAIDNLVIKSTRKENDVSVHSVAPVMDHALHNGAGLKEEEDIVPQLKEIPDLMLKPKEMSKTVLGIILGGGAGSRLYPLTKSRAKPAVPLGANYRLIDVPVSNCLNSGINKIYCLTQFNSASLNRHLSQAYNTSSSGQYSRGFVEVLAASQSSTSQSWFQGTADAVRKYLWLFDEMTERDGIQDYVILSGDHLYRMDYRDFVRKHRETEAAITIAALPCDEKRATSFGLMKIDDEGRIIDFSEKPKGEALKRMQVDTTVLGVDAKTAREKPYIASMGIYVMKASVLKTLLEETLADANDFGNEVIPLAKEAGLRVQAFAFDGYWEDIGTIESFYNANIALANPAMKNFSFYKEQAPIYTMSRFLPPSKVQDADIKNSIIGDGTVIKAGSQIRNSVVGLRSVINEDCRIEDSLIMGSDHYELKEECLYVPGCLPMGIGARTVVKRAIIDKNARIGEDCKIINKDGVMEANREDQGFVIKDGIIVILKNFALLNKSVI